MLQDPHPVGKLRAAGWTVPAEVPDSYLLRVYDTRIDPQWLQGLAQELSGPGLATFVVGGDFLTRPRVEDAVALHPTDLRRWGPEGDAPCCLVVPPRPHLASWAQRCVAQMRMEAPDTTMLLCAVVPREQCSGGGDRAALERMLPQATSLFACKELQVDVRIVGERAPVCRVPAS